MSRVHLLLISLLAILVSAARAQESSPRENHFLETGRGDRHSPGWDELMALKGEPLAPRFPAVGEGIERTVLENGLVPLQGVSDTVAALGAAVAYGKFSIQKMVTALLETAKISVMILFIIAASVTFSQILAFSGATNGLLALIETVGASPFMLLIAMLLVLLFLGAFMDQVSMIMITLPFFIPLAQSLDLNLLWFGVLMLVVMEISFMTPPFGLLIYVMKGVAPKSISLKDVYTAALPFIGLQLVVLGILIAFPEVATWLASLIRK